MGILRHQPPVSKAPPIRLTDAELDSLDADPVCPTPSQRLRLWTWIVRKLPFLQIRFAGPNEVPRQPDLDDMFVGKLLHSLCDPQVREVFLAVLSPGTRAIVRDEIRKGARP